MSVMVISWMIIALNYSCDFCDRFILRGINMNEYAKLNISEEYVHVWFYNEMDKPFLIGKKMGELNSEAYMNGYNWDSFFNYYLSQNAPDLLKGLDPDPEAGSYVAIYERTPENEIKGKKFVEIIEFLIENEEEIYRIVREEGEQIQWD